MNVRSSSIVFVLFVALMLATSYLCVAQPGSNPNEGGAPGTAPISGIEILIGLGGLLGAKKLFDTRKKNQELP